MSFWSNGASNATTHAYVIDIDILRAIIARGWC